MSNDYRFQIEDVQDGVLDPDYGYHDGIDAFVSSHHEHHHMVVELTSTEPDESQRVTESFRVTVERIDPALSRGGQ